MRYAWFLFVAVAILAVATAAPPAFACAHGAERPERDGADLVGDRFVDPIDDVVVDPPVSAFIDYNG